MKKNNTIKKIFIGFFVVLLLLIGYAAMNGSGNEGQENSSTLTSLLNVNSLGQIQDTDTALANAEILRILGSIKDIQLEDDIFDDPVFKELRDGRFVIPNPRTIGRPNPFLPIGFTSFSSTPQSSVSTQTNAQTTSISDISSDNGLSESSGFFSGNEL
jgi:hypothetical protein